MVSAQSWIDQLNLMPHPEGGYYSEIYRSLETVDSQALPQRYSEPRSLGTSIYFLLEGHQVSRFHRLKSDELWYFHSGSAARIHMVTPDGEHISHLIGQNVGKDESLQVLIPHNHWFAVEVLDASGYVLVGCAVFPGFEFQDFELGDFDILMKNYSQHEKLIRRFL